MEKPDIEKLLSEIREQVRVRRIAGDYPPGLEQQLEAEFRGIINRERRDSTTVREQLIEHSNKTTEAFERISGVTPIQSRFPGGSLFHRAIRKVTARQTRGLANQIREATSELANLVNLIVDLQLAQEEADRRLVIHLSKSVIDRLAVVDHLAIVVRELERRNVID